MVPGKATRYRETFDEAQASGPFAGRLQLVGSPAVSLTETTTKTLRKAQAPKAANEAKRPQPAWLQGIRAAPAREKLPPAAPERVGEAQGPPRLIPKAEVLVVAGCTYPTLWKMMREGNFPRSRAVGGKSMWLSTEVDAWMAALPLRRLKGDVP
jgi:predicted DNA-binding transcriptional regulator AlpA